MNILNNLNEIFRVDASNNASNEMEIAQLIDFSPINVPLEYLELIREKTEIEININDKMYIRLWGASGCIELNEAYLIQKYIPSSLAIGDNEGGDAILYAEGKNGFGIYTVAFNDLDIDEMIYISKSLVELLVYSKGVEKLIKI